MSRLLAGPYDCKLCQSLPGVTTCSVLQLIWVDSQRRMNSVVTHWQVLAWWPLSLRNHSDVACLLQQPLPLQLYSLPRSVSTPPPTLALVTCINTMIHRQGSTFEKVADWTLAVAIPVHSHISMNAVVTDYIPKAFRGEVPVSWSLVWCLMTGAPQGLRAWVCWG
jgi:hypothetical protein